MRSIAASVGLLLVSVTVTSCLSSTGAEPALINRELERDVIEISQQDERVRRFIAGEPDYSCQISVVEPETAAELAREQPVIYGGLPNKALYRIEYESNNKGILVVVDLEAEKILKYFRTVGVSLE